MKFKVDFANGRCTTISCDSNEEAKKELLSVQNRFNSKIIAVNDQPIEKLSLGGFLLGSILGGILGNELAKSGVSKTAKTIKSTTKKTISKTKKAIAEFRTTSNSPKKMSVERKFVNKSEDYEVRYAKQSNPSRVGYKQNKKYKQGGGVSKSGFAIMQRGELRTDAFKRVEFFPTIEKALWAMSHIPFYKSLTKEEKTKLVVPYTKTKFEGGGNVEEEVFIKYINKDKGFKPDTKEFSSYAEAMEWGKANIEKFNPDSINYKFAKGGGTQKKTKINKKYTHFAVSKETGKIRDAWETLDDIETLKYYANIDLKDNDLNPKDFNILSNKTLIRRGVDPYDSDNWTKTSEYAKGGGVGSMDKWFVTIDYYEPSVKEDRSGNKLSFYMKTFKVEASSKEEAFTKATDLYNSVKANKNRQIERINAFKLPSYATGGMSGMGMAAASPHFAIADQISQRLPATTAAIDKNFAERVNPNRSNIWEDRGLQKMATGGTIGQEIVFDRWGETATGTITEKMANGNFSVVSGMSSYLVEPSQVISINPHTEKTKQGWFFANGGSVNTGLSWHQDRARHNKSESYERPLADRKKK